MVEKLISEIKNDWFYSEPLLFSVACTHVAVENKALSVPMRSGRMRIEYSPMLLSKMNKPQIEECLKLEMFRILLGHPYQRQPYNAKKGILLLASDITINHFYKPQVEGIELSGVAYFKTQARRFREMVYPLGEKWDNTEELRFFQKNLNVDRNTGRLNTIDDLSYEEWYKKILFLVKETSIAGTENAGKGNGSDSLSQFTDDAAELWEENDDALSEIQEQINRAEIDCGWGGLGGGLQREIKEQCDFSFDYRRALAQFRQNIVSANRKLTRMRPSRRYGFQAMGSRYERKANILIAVDVSGSITDESFEHFYHAIKNFFFLGIIEKIDLIFFDVNLKNTKAVTFSKNINLKEIQGKGGTSFQPAIDFFAEHKSDYSGLIIFTDGQGDIPLVPAGTSNILWILDSRLSFEKSHQWINSLPGNKSTYLPF